MPQSVTESTKFPVGDILTSIRKDLVVIILAAMLIALAGGVAAKMALKYKSHAQLVLTPMPLRSKAVQDAFAVMLAPPLDVTSISLLCLSDEVLQDTFDQLDQLHDAGQLQNSFANITKLKNALSFQVTVAKETPYDLVYTPVLELTAKGDTASDAKTIVNAWAEIVAGAVKKVQDAVQKPAAEALNGRLEELTGDLTQAELESQKFWTENNIEYIKSRMETVVGLMLDYKANRNELETGLITDRAAVASFSEEEQKEQPKITLDWKPSEELLATLGPKLGLNISKKDAGDKSLISMEHFNTVYWELHGKVAATRAGIATKEAQMKSIDQLIADLDKERLQLQEEYAKVEIEKGRIGRKLERIQAAYSNIATKQEFAQIASSLNHPAVQVISKGTEWPMPRFRGPLLLGGIAGMLGFLLAAGLSVFYRLLLKPALEH